MSTFANWSSADVAAHNARAAGVKSNSEGSIDAAERESDLHYEIIDYCKSRGWLYFHGSMAHRTRRGIGEPDFTVLADKGRVLFVECKAKNGKMSPAQMGVALQADILGHKVHVVENMSQFYSIVSK